MENKRYKIKGKHKGQALTEYVIIIVFVGFALVFATSDLFDSIRNNYYNGMFPISNKSELPEPPENIELELAPKKGPVAKIEGPRTVTIGEKVVFTDSSYSHTSRITGTSWGTGTLEKTFIEEGQHIIALEVVDSNGQSDITEMVVYVQNTKPSAVIKVTPNKTPDKVEIVKVSGLDSYDKDDHAINDWEWYMTSPNGERKKMDWSLEGYQFKPNQLNSGSYKFELKVKDEYGKWSDVSTETINVS